MTDSRGQSGPSRDEKLRNLSARAGRLRSERVAGGNSQNRRSADTQPAGGKSPGVRSTDARREGRESERQPGKRASQVKPNSLVGFVRRNIGYIALVALVVALATVGVFAIKAFLPVEAESDAAGDASMPSASVVPFDWTKLDRSDGRYRYVEDGEVKSRIGVDVSENQRDIDWQAVAADGIEFAIVRVGYRGSTEGGLYLDAHFRENIEGARAAGIACGAYFFSQADTVQEAREEADFVLEQLAGIELEYPVAFDSEVVNLKDGKGPTAGLSQDEMTAIADTFCSRISEAGYSPLLYGNRVDLERYRLDDLGGILVWWAEYGAPAPTTRLAMDYWQYSNGGKVAGISTVVDLNLDLRDALENR